MPASAPITSKALAIPRRQRESPSNVVCESSITVFNDSTRSAQQHATNTPGHVSGRLGPTSGARDGMNTRWFVSDSTARKISRFASL
jgi:hypothetical protein